MYEQLKSPNLSIVGQPEECLVYVREVFGIGPKYPTAAAGWEGAQYKHSETPPLGISVPVWFSWKTDGHVALWGNGLVYSTSAEGDKTFNDITDLIDFIGDGIEYLGWSEDVDGVRVVAPAPVSTPVSVSVKVNPGNWYVRSSPNTGVASLGLALGGQQYGAVINSAGWAQISFRGQTGYLGPAAFTKL